MSADLRHVDAWLFDLDDTLYPAETELMNLIRERITLFVMELTGADRETSRVIQTGWFAEHGAALPGLLAEHNVTPEAFLDFVHDVPLDRVPPDPELAAALARLPGRRLIFTNGADHHARRVLERIGVADLFEGVFHILSGDLIPKPAPKTYARMIDAFALDPSRVAFFEDSERNLEHAAMLGMTTVLVGPHAEASTAPFVHYRTPRLTPFLQTLRFQEPTP